MRKVEFYELGGGFYKKIGEVRLADDGSLDFSNEELKAMLESEAVVLAGNVVLRQTDPDKEAWFMALPLGFRGSAFRASEVMEV